MSIEKALDQYTMYAPYMSEIVENFKELRISGMVFYRVYNDGSVINLASRPEWTQLYYKNVYSGQYDNQALESSLLQDQGLNLWISDPSNKAWLDLQDYLGYGNGITLCDHTKHYKESMMVYSTAENREINNFYVNNLDLLKNIKLYVKDKANDLIAHAEKNKDKITHHPSFKRQSSLAQFESNNALITTLKNKPHHLDWNTIYRISSEELGTLLNKRSYSIEIGNTTTTLSKMEIKTLAELIKNKHAGEIAHSLNIKQSTVESYLCNIKNKLGVNLKSELITLITNSRLLQQIEL